MGSVHFCGIVQTEILLAEEKGNGNEEVNYQDPEDDKKKTEIWKIMSTY